MLPIGVLSYGTSLVGQFNLSSPAYTSAGVYKSSDQNVLLRQLWYNQYKLAGVHTAYWDGLDDFDNNVIASNDYIVKVLTHNVQSTWHTIGNTSATNHGYGVMHSYFPFVDMDAVGDKLRIGHSFDEGTGRVGYMLKISEVLAGNQINYNILNWDADPTGNNPLPNNTNLSTEFICSNTNYTFYGGVDPGNGDSWVHAIKNSDDSELALTSGTTKDAASGRRYAHAIDIVTGNSSNKITGIACNDTYLWVARGSQSSIKCYNIAGPTPAGSLVNTNTTFTNPRWLKHQTTNDRIWMVTGSGSVVDCSTGSGTLTSLTLTVSDFPSNKLGLAINNSTNELIIIVGGTTQQLWFWNIASTTVSGTHTKTFGQLGGYQSTSVLANDRFCFSDNTSGLVKGTDKPYVTIDSNGNYFIGDVGLNRCQVFNSSMTYLTTIMMQGALYGVSHDMNNPSKVYLSTQEFTINESNDTWTYSRTFQPQLGASYFKQGFDMFTWCSTLSNGKIYATLPNGGISPEALEIVELTNSGIRYTGVFCNDPSNVFRNFLDKDFNLWRITTTSDWSVGVTPIIQKKTLTGFSSNNPTYGSWTNVVTLQAIQAGDALQSIGYEGFCGFTDSGLLCIRNRDITATCQQHLQWYNMTTGAKVQGNWRPTTKASGSFLGYIGIDFPDPTHYDIGNSVARTFEDAQVCGEITVVDYIGEFWNGVQTSYFNFYKNGLAFLQLGTDRIKGNAADSSGVSGLEVSGNGFSFRTSMLDSDTMVVISGDESVKGAGHRHKLTGISGISIISVPIAPPTTEPLLGVSLLDFVPLNGLITNTGSGTGAITGDNAVSGYTIQSGNVRYERHKKELALRFDAGILHNTLKVKNVALPAYNPSLTTWSVWGEISFSDFLGPENGNSNPSATLEILDNTNKIIARIGLGQSASSNFPFKLWLNSSLLIDTIDDNIKTNVIQRWQSFNITTTASGCVITYGVYSPVSVAIFDPTAAWNKPTLARVVGKDLNTFFIGTRCIAVEPLRYVDS